MKLVQIEYSVEATVNTGDFSNVRPGFRVVVEPEEGERPAEVKDKLVAIVDKWLQKEVDEIRATVVR